MKSRTSSSDKFFRLIWVAALALVLACVGTAAAVGYTGKQIYADLESSLPELGWAEDRTPPETTRIFARDGRLVATLYRENRTYRQLDEISPTMIQALVAIEDARFFQHNGVDLRGVARAAVANLRSGTIQEGASTISMQLARILFLTQETSFWRKAREALLARKLEQRMSKSEILERYLNEVYFGSGAYGVAAAASLYFGVQADQLDAAQSALLASLVQAPTELSPYQDPQAARYRQLLVLGRMRDLGYLDQADYRKALDRVHTMKLRPERDNEPLLKYPYFTSYAIHQLSEMVSDRQLYQDGLRIYTTLDLELQRMAEEELRYAIDAYGPSYNADNAALVLIENETGAIRAMVGGRKWSTDNQFNRAWQARRQPGSSFKAFLYTAALEAGYSPESVVADSKTTIDLRTGKSWTPQNADGSYMGKIPLREALRMSRNAVAARLVSQLGTRTVADVAYRMGIDSDLPIVPALALGAGEVTPLEMTEAFSTFANGGTHVEPRAIKLITHKNGEPMHNNQESWRRHAISEDVAAGMTEMLMRVVRNGTGTGAALPGIPVAGKTGTTDSFKDAWFVGFTPRYTMAVWVGRDDNRPTWGVYGGTLPATIWRRVMAGAHAGQSPGTFAHLEGKEKQLKLCKTSHLLATEACDTTYKSVFWGDNHPDAKCDECGRSLKEFDLLIHDYPKADQPARTPPAAAVAPTPEPLPAPEPAEVPSYGLDGNYPRADEAGYPDTYDLGVEVYPEEDLHSPGQSVY